jgi:DNA repair photolyase
VKSKLFLSLGEIKMKYISTKTIISPKKNNSNSWFGCDYNMNIYRGCCHGCIYCDSRSSCYQIEDFHEVVAKENALFLIEKELASKRTKGVIGTGAMSDPYNPFEKEYELTKAALNLVNKYEFGINIITKSDLVTRDIQILKEINTHSPVCVGITITTASDSLTKKIEPDAVSSSKRFEVIDSLHKNGIYTGVLMMPILPFINDNEDNILSIIKSAAQCKADFIYPLFGVTLRAGQREYFYSALDKHFPGLKEKYKSTFGDSYECLSPHSKTLWKLFSETCENYNISYKMPDIIRGSRNSIKQKQLSFLE